MTVYPVQMHNTSQMSFNPNTGLIYVPIAVENTFSFVAAETYTPTPGSQNFPDWNLGGARGGTPTASPRLLTDPDRKNWMEAKCVEVFSARGIPLPKRNAGSRSAAARRVVAHKFLASEPSCFKRLSNGHLKGVYRG